MMDLKPYSLSRLSLYEMCPRRFKFKYIDKLPELVEDAGQFGRLVHEMIAKQLKGEGIDDLLVDLPDEERDRALDYVKKAISFDVGKVIGVEVKFAVDENLDVVDFESSKAVLRGIIDVVSEKDGEYYIWDWKTGRSKPTAFQIMFYAFVLYKNLPISKAGYVLLSSNEALLFDVDMTGLKLTAKKVDGLIKKLEQDEEFKPKAGPHCAYCSWIEKCPLNMIISAKDIPAVRNDEEAKEILEATIVLKEKLKRYQKALKGYLEQKDNPVLNANGFIALLDDVTYKRLKKGVDKELILSKVLETEDPLKFIEFKDVYEIVPDFFDVQKRKMLKIQKEG